MRHLLRCTACALSLASLTACGLVGDGSRISGISPTDDEGTALGNADPDDWRVRGTPTGRVWVSTAFPNPAGGQATFRLDLEREQQVRIRLLDDRLSEVSVIHDGPLAPSLYAFAVPAPGRGLYRVELEGEGWQAHGDIRFQ